MLNSDTPDSLAINNLSLVDVLSEIQKKINVPKERFNEFGNYTFRSYEDILTEVKPLLPPGFCITLSDEIVLIGNRYYCKASARIFNKDDAITVTSFAREPEERKKFDCSQITGATSSYSHKYALGGLLLLDDQRDIDALPPPILSTDKEPEKEKSDEKTDSQIKEITYWLMEMGDNKKEEASKILTSLTKYKDFPGFSTSGELICLKERNQKWFYKIYSIIKEKYQEFAND